MDQDDDVDPEEELNRVVNDDIVQLENLDGYSEFLPIPVEGTSVDDDNNIGYVNPEYRFDNFEYVPRNVNWADTISEFSIDNDDLALMRDEYLLIANNEFMGEEDCVCPGVIVQEMDNTMIDLRYVKVSCTERDNRVRVSIDLGTEEVDTVIPKKFDSDKMNLIKNTVHDFTFKILMDDINTDQSLEILHPMGVRLTPDGIDDLGNGNYLVSEYATSQSTDIRTLTNVFNGKKDKYFEEIERRIRLSGKSQAVYLITVVSSSAVVCNWPIPKRMANVLCLRYRISNLIREELAKLNLIENTNEYTERQKAVISQLSSLEMKFSDKKFSITEELYGRIMSPRTEFIAEARFREEVEKESMNIIDLLHSIPKDIEAEKIDSYWMRTTKNAKGSKASFNPKSDNKHISQYPLFTADECISLNYDLVFDYDEESLENDTFVEDEDVFLLKKMWLEASLNATPYEDHTDELVERAQMPGSEASSKEFEKSTYKSKYCRTQIETLNDFEHIKLAEQGINAKAYSHIPELVQRRLITQLPLNPDCNTNDIDFDINISSEWLLDTSIHQPLHSDQNILELIELAIGTKISAQFSDKKYIDALMQTKGYRAMRILSDIAMELSISLKQNCKKNEYILKKLLHFNIWILIKTTRSDSHIFFSILVNNKLNSDGLETVEFSPFKTCRKFVQLSETFYATEFVSCDVGRLQNLIKLPSIFILNHHFCSLDSIDSTTIDSHPIDLTEIGRQHLSFLTLITLENKKCTEAVITNWRYSLMSMLSNIDPDRWRTIENLPTMFRSRLQIWIVKQQLRAMSTMIKLSPKLVQREDTTDSSTDNFKNLIDFVTHKELTTFTQALNTCYYGYMVDKNLIINDNYLGALLDKVLSVEFKYREVREEYFGNLESEDHRYHEFSLDLLKAICDNGQDYLMSKYGDDWQNIIGNHVAYQLGGCTFEELATLKASANVEGWDEKVEHYKNSSSENTEAVTNLSEYKEYLLKTIETLKEGTKDSDISELTEQHMDVYKEFMNLLRKPNKTSVEEERYKSLKKELNRIQRKRASLTKDGLCKMTELQPNFKVMTQVVKILNEFDMGDEKMKHKQYLPIMEAIKSIMEIENECGHLIMRIFPKKQVGSAREIFILDIRGRLLQYHLEVMAKTISNNFESDCLSDPGRKQRIPNEHYKAIASLDPSRTVTQGNASDGKKWSQSMLIAVLCAILLRFLPKEYHAFIVRALNTWVEREVIMPEAILNQLKYNPSAELSSEIRNEIRDQFVSGGETVRKFGKTISLKTGMGQGILHFVSNLLHVLAQFWVKTQLMKICQPGREENKIKVKISQLCSSDDSSALVTVEAKDIYVAELYATILCRSMNKTLERICIIQSPKSALSLPYIMEFNSTWTILTTTAIPQIKFWNSALTLPANESLVERQSHFSTLLTQCLENGSFTRSVHIIQLAQSIIHYQMLGYSTNSLFDLYKKYISKIKDPYLGFFFLDEPLIAGLMGFKFNLYSELKLNVKLSSIAKSMLEPGRFNFTPYGNMNYAGYITHGNKEKYKRFFKKLNLGENVLYEIETNPIIMYKLPETVIEEKAKIYLKATAPGVRDTFNTEATAIKNCASSVYSISFACITQKGNRYTFTEFEKAFSKAHNILPEETKTLKTKCREIIKEIKTGKGSSLVEKNSLIHLAKSNSYVPNQPLTEEDMAWLFPESNTYEDILRIVNYVTCSTVPSPWCYARKTKCIITIPVSKDICKLTLESLIKQVHFNISSRAHRTLIENEWSKLKLAIPWIKDTHPETLKASPFDNYIDLHNYICTFNTNDRTIRLTSSVLKGMGFQNTVEKFIRRNWQSRTKFTLYDASVQVDSNPMIDAKIKSLVALVPHSNDTLAFHSARLNYLSQIINTTIDIPLVNKLSQEFRDRSSMQTEMLRLNSRESMLDEYSIPECMSYLANLNALPLLPTDWEQHVMTLFSKTRSMTDQEYNYAPERHCILSTMIKLSQLPNDNTHIEERKNVLINHRELSSTGIFGYYDIPQKYDVSWSKDKGGCPYKGFGRWVGMILNMSILIEFMDDYVTSIQVSNLEFAKRNYKHICDIVKSSHSKEQILNTYQKQEQKLYLTQNGIMNAIHTTKGIPIREVRNLNLITDLDKMDVFLNFNYNRRKITICTSEIKSESENKKRKEWRERNVKKMNEIYNMTKEQQNDYKQKTGLVIRKNSKGLLTSNRAFDVLSFYSKYYDRCLVTKQLMPTSVWTIWCTGSALSSALGEQLLKLMTCSEEEIEKMMKGLKFNIEKLRTFISQVTRATLRSQGLLTRQDITSSKFSNPLRDESFHQESFEESSTEIQDFNNYFHDKILNYMTTKRGEIDREIEVYKNEFAEDIQENNENVDYDISILQRYINNLGTSEHTELAQELSRMAIDELVWKSDQYKIISSHDFLVNCLSRKPREWWKIVLSGRLPSNGQEFATTMFEILNIEPSSEPLEEEEVNTDLFSFKEN